VTVTGGPGPVRAAVVSDLFTDAVVYELWGDGDEALLHPEEAVLVASAVANRRQQFAAGRACARRALADLALEDRPLMVGDRRSPRWPEGVTGSISHTEGYAVAVVARLGGGHGTGRDAASGELPVRTVGIDAERCGRVSDDLHGRLFLDPERERMAGLSAQDRAEMATVMFGAKEAFYKAQFPITGDWVGFHDVELRPDGDELTLHPASDLETLARFRWPLRARTVVRRGIAVTGVEAVVPHL